MQTKFAIFALVLYTAVLSIAFTPPRKGQQPRLPTHSSDKTELADDCITQIVEAVYVMRGAYPERNLVAA